jgi:murein tripeptide amidase MpaA
MFIVIGIAWWAAAGQPSVMTQLAAARNILLCRSPGLSPAPPGNGAAPVSVSLPPDYAFDRYLTAAEQAELLAQWQTAFPSLMELEEMGQSHQQRPILAVRLAGPNGPDADSRPALYLDGQHHAQEAVSANLVLYLLWHLLSSYGDDPVITHLLNTRTLYAIPSVNPDGNDLFLTVDQNQRKNANPTAADDDGDGLVDEDPPETAGWGTANLRRVEFEASWLARNPYGPLESGWPAHMTGAPTPLGVVTAEGQPATQSDNDGDGALNEDGPGGVDLNRNYDTSWPVAVSEPPASHTYSGATPFSEPESRAVRDFVLAHPNIVLAVTLHSGSDLLLYPWGAGRAEPVPDLAWYEAISAKAAQLTARLRTPTPYASAGYPGFLGYGSTMDWLYRQGILAWTAEIYIGETVASLQPEADGRFVIGMSPGLRYAPPDEQMLPVLERWRPWLVYMLAATPNLSILNTEKDGEQWQVVLGNDGLLPLAVEFQQGDQPILAPLLLASGVQTMTLPAGDASTSFTIRATPALAVANRHRQMIQLSIEDGASEGRYRDLAADMSGWYATSAWRQPFIVRSKQLCRALDALEF